jgi:arylsulfatase A-like enzyme
VNFAELAMVGHSPSYLFRGAKSDIYEGGHHIPYLAEWPAVVRAGSRCEALACQTELLATCANAIGTKLPEDAGEDSASILPLLAETADCSPPFPAVINHSLNGSFSIIRGEWKLELCPDSGGWSSPVPLAVDAFDPPQRPPVQLYNLRTDIGEHYNVHRENSALVKELFELALDLIGKGRSTPGLPQKNAETCSWPQYERLLTLKLDICQEANV